ncbi:MAG: DUF1499 domain-containing protein, partial [Nitrospirota bacterium]
CNVGVMPRVLKPCPSSPNCVSSLAEEDANHRVPPLGWIGDLDQAKARLRQAVLAAGHATFVVEEGTYWHIEFRSRVFRFVDDVEFLFDAQTRLIHVRSASRMGHSDLGVNRARVEKIRAIFRIDSYRHGPYNDASIHGR